MKTRHPEILVVCPEIGITTPMVAKTHPERYLGSVLVPFEAATRIVPLINSNKKDGDPDILYWDGEFNLVWKENGLVAGPDDDGLFNLSSEFFVLWSEVK